MDRSSNQTLAADATTDLSVSSVASSLANLDLNPSPISRLPKKLLQRILSKVERMVPIQEFALLREVDTRWLSIVGDICKDKKSLILLIVIHYEMPFYWRVGDSFPENKFFGLFNEEDFMRVKIHGDYEVDSDCDSYVYMDGDVFEALLKVFPNIEQLCICCPKSDQFEGELISYVKSLGSLKQLYVYGRNFDHLMKSQLEFFFFNVNSNIFVRSGALSFDYVRQLHARNPRWLVNVAQLYFLIGLNDQFDQVVPFLREHATRLTVLYIKFCDSTLMTAAVFGHLGKLTQLTEIALGPVNFELLKQMATAVEESNFTPLGTIITYNLLITDFDYSSVTVDQFTGVLLAIFPNVVNWKFAFVPMSPCKVLDSFQNKLKQSLSANIFHLQNCF